MQCTSEKTFFLHNLLSENVYQFTFHKIQLRQKIFMLYFFEFIIKLDYDILQNLVLNFNEEKWFGRTF